MEEAVMITIFEQVFVLVAFGGIGYALSKGGLVQSSHADLLSKLLVYVILPAAAFRTYAQNFTVAYISENYVLILASLGILAALMVLTRVGLLVFCPKSPDRNVYEYSVNMPNFGYMGYPFVEALYGSVGLLSAMVFAIPMSLYVYTFGYTLLSGKRATLKNVFNPMMCALLLGALCGITGLGAYIPTVAYTLLSNANACMGPISMLLAGIVLSDYKFGELFRRPSVYIVSLIRILVIPFAVGGVLRLFGANEILFSTAVSLYAMPCGLNTLVFVKNAGGDCRPGAALALVSNVLACASIPLVLYLFGVSI